MSDNTPLMEIVGLIGLFGIVIGVVIFTAITIFGNPENPIVHEEHSTNNIPVVKVYDQSGNPKHILVIIACNEGIVCYSHGFFDGVRGSALSCFDSTSPVFEKYCGENK